MINLENKNKIILVTKEPDEAWDSVSPLIEGGFRILFFPTISTVYSEPENERKEEVFNTNFDYLIFTSPNSVKFFLQFLRFNQIDFDFNGTTVAATGSKTAETCKAFEINVQIIPDEFSAKGLLKTFAGLETEDKNILIPVSSIARDELIVGLRKLGANVYPLIVYNTVKAKPTVKNFDKVKNENPEYFIFTSPSSFKNYLEIMRIDKVQEYFAGKKVVAIGRTTAEAIKENGIEDVQYPDEFTLKSASEFAAKL